MSTGLKNSTQENSENAPIKCVKVVNNTNISDFVRAAYISVFTANTPIEICDAKFEQASMQTRNYTLVVGEYDLSYSVTLGFDRKEEYLATEEYKDSDGVKRTRQVTKTRTVTDWRPTSGNYTGRNNAINREGNNGGYLIQRSFERCILSDVNKNLAELDENDTELLPYIPSAIEQTATMKWGAELLSFDCKQKLGGDHQKDFNYTYKANPQAVYGIISQEYVLPFAMGNNSYSVESYSNKIIPLQNAPKDETDSQITGANRKRITKTLGIMIAPFWTLFAVCFLIGVIIAIAGGNVEGLSVFLPIVFVLCIVLTVVWTILNYKAWKGISEKQVQSAQTIRDQKKCECLNAKLMELELAPLTEEETSLFAHLGKVDETFTRLESFVLKLDKFVLKKKK